MATAIPVCRPHASEARRPGSGSRAGGVSRAERGNDGSPNGARRPGGSMRNAHDSATGHVSWPGTHSLQGSMHKLMRQSSGNRFDSDCRGLADPAQPVRRSLRGAKHRAAGIARRAFPWRQAKRAAHQARRYRQRAQQKKRCAAPAGTTHQRQRGAISSPPSSTATGRSRQAQRTRKPARPRSAR